MIIHNPILTGSFTVNGTDVSSITSSAASITAINAYTASQNILNGTYTLTSSFAAQTASFTAFTSSVNTFTASQLVLNGTYATTGSNIFTSPQTINSNLIVTGSITAQTLVVQTITSSVDFVTGSTRFGSILGNTHVFSGSVTMNPGGLFVSSSGLVGIGNIVPAYTLDVSGTGRFTGITSLTSATASTSTTTGGLVVTGGIGIGGALFGTSATFSGSLTVTGAYNVPSTSFFKGNATYGFRFNNAADTVNLFILADSGAATFSSSVTATQGKFSGSRPQGIFTENGTSGLYLRDATGTGYKSWSIGTNDIVVGFAITPSTAVGGTTFTTPSFVINESGNVLIGTTTDSGYKLDVNGTFRATGAATFSSVVSGYAVSITNVQDSSQGLLVRASDNDTGAYILNLQSSAGATSETWVQRFVVEKGGNVGIGTTSPQTKLHITAASAISSSTLLTIDGGEVSFSSSNDANTGYSINFDGCSYSGASGIVQRTGAQIQMLKQGSWNEANGAPGTYGNLVFKTNNGTIASPSLTERMRITAGGFLKASNDGTYIGAASSYHELVTNIANTASVIIGNKNASTPYGCYVLFTAASPNDSTRWFYNAEDSTATRFTVRSNGGIANFQANDTNLSDIRTKKDIIPLESYWDKFKAIEIVKFKYKDQTHDDYNIGLIAQQLESIAPEFIDTDGWGKQDIENEEPLKSVYTADLHHATIKVLQEAMTKIEEQQIQIQNLQEQINAK